MGDESESAENTLSRVNSNEFTKTITGVSQDQPIISRNSSKKRGAAL